MKKTTFMAILLLTGATLMAQQGKREASAMVIRDATPEQMATLHTKKMTLALDLDEAQQTEIQKINLEHAKMRKAKMEERRAMQEKRALQKPTTEEKYAMKMEQLDKQIAHKARMKKILSAEQYQKWEKMAARKMNHKKREKRKRTEDRK
ncbi:hypothetical protein [Costertonia aggregata]|uniref:DUF4890 domain-containing protein n=1 Tax=Costertonia aggregata TaxID=343403 RepID=A0A7H9AR60_9FLAO|nr:hypothetical protein [Costertonia aggregata]QLG45920.1 hypothetical protein HYG79_11355 [Costertonia aggregata]